MKKNVPDPPENLLRKFAVPAGKSLSTAILEGLVPIEEVLSNACHFMLHAYTDAYHAHDTCADVEVRQLMSASMRSLEIALGQADALVGALRQVPGSGFGAVH